MSFFGLSESAFRFASFATILVVMALLETIFPRRARRISRQQRWTTNFSILLTDYAAVFVVIFLGMASAVAAAAFAAGKGWGILNLIDLPVWLELLIAFVILDFVIWGQHVATHKIPMLWRLHRVHHSDQDMDASTAIRFHPLEIIFSIFLKSIAVLIIGPAVVAVILFEAFVNGTALFNHANVRLPKWLDATVRLVFVTPDFHRVHHSTIVRETDSNYGFGLSVWDRIFGTYNAQPELGHDDMKIGLDDWQGDGPSSFIWSFSLPFFTPPKTKPIEETDKADAR